jgi:hypothetical protein
MDSCFHPAHTRPGRKLGADLSIRAFIWHKMASLECKGNSLKVKWSHTESAQSRHICAHEEVRELNPVFQIDP